LTVRGRYEQIHTLRLVVMRKRRGWCDAKDKRGHGHKEETRAYTD